LRQGGSILSYRLFRQGQRAALAAGEQTQKESSAYNKLKFQHGKILLACLRPVSFTPPPTMTDHDYLTQAEALLKAVEASCDRINDTSVADIDNQRVGSMITMIFTDRSQIIINLQKPLHEVWMATKAGGFHYKYERGAWQSTREGSEFFADLSLHASAQSGLALVFSS
jgi:CyaY protein